MENMKGTLYVPPHQAHTGDSTFLSIHYVLRHCNADYRIATNSYTALQQPPELDGNKILGKIAPLLTFDNQSGHIFDNGTRVFDISHHSTLHSFVEFISQCCRRSLDRWRAWDLDGLKLIKLRPLDHNNTYEPLCEHNKYFARVMNSQYKNPYCPISVHPIQAYIESSEKRGTDSSIYKLSSQSTVVPGMWGGFHNNNSVEMGFDEPEGTKNVALRAYDEKYKGFLSAGFTPHSADAGKTRRVCNYTRVRVVSERPLWSIENITVNNDGPWIVYCMGSTFSTDLNGITTLVDCLYKGLYDYYSTQFNYPHISQCRSPPTFMVYHREKILYISISPGVILRSTVDGCMVDNYMLYHQVYTPLCKNMVVDSKSEENIKYFFDAFYQTQLFPHQGRQPRGEFAASQLPQAVCLPWSPATARVSPIYPSKQLLATEFVRQMEADHDTNPEAIWDIVPGSDLIVCFMNLPGNYEDSIIMASHCIDRGMFSTMSLCTYRISEKDKVPTIGERLCGKVYKWWKMPCTSSCTCKPKSNKKIIYLSVKREPTAKVVDITRTADGALSIKVESFAQFQGGDKCSTYHGQKGVVLIEDTNDLPILVKDGLDSFTADIYMAVGSVVTRETMNQMYESGASWRAARDGIRNAIANLDDIDTEQCDFVIHPHTGRPYEGRTETGEIVLLQPTFGMIRVVDQTQKTRERQHFTHNSEGKYSLGTKPGRAAGGGVSMSEMGFHALIGTGRFGIAQEIYNRGNMVRVLTCQKCGRLERICHITKCSNSGESSMKPVRMSHELSVLDYISVCVGGSSNEYTIEHI